MSSLYEYLKNDREDVLGRISKTLVKRMFLHPQYHSDALHECYLAWMESEYDPLFDNDSILSYAFNCARLRLVEWRRRTLLVACTTRSESPEPRGISLDELNGEALELFIQETELFCLSALDDLLYMKRLEDEDAADSDFVAEMPADPTGRMEYEKVFGMLRNGETLNEIAGKMGVNRRTIYRRAKLISEVNSR